MHERIKIRTSRELQLVWRGKRQRNKRESSLFGKSVGNERNQTSSGQTTRNLNRVSNLIKAKVYYVDMFISSYSIYKIWW
nr:hypothetical protein CFP56_68902 [Quercus suber]